LIGFNLQEYDKIPSHLAPNAVKIHK